MERVSRAFLFHEELSTQDEEATLEEALEHVLWCALLSNLKNTSTGRCLQNPHDNDAPRAVKLYSCRCALCNS